MRFFEARCRTSLPTFSLSGYSIMEDNCLWQKTKTEIHVTTVFDGELDAADVFVSLIAQKIWAEYRQEKILRKRKI